MSSLLMATADRTLALSSLSGICPVDVTVSAEVIIAIVVLIIRFLSLLFLFLV
jgi:hypothetical protein